MEAAHLPLCLLTSEGERDSGYNGRAKNTGQLLADTSCLYTGQQTPADTCLRWHLQSSH